MLLDVLGEVRAISGCSRRFFGLSKHLSSLKTSGPRIPRAAEILTADDVSFETEDQQFGLHQVLG